MSVVVRAHLPFVLILQYYQRRNASLSSAPPLLHPPPSPPLTESLCIYFPSSHSCVWHEEVPRFHADNHNGTQVRYKAATGSSWTSSKHLQLGGARPAVGKWVSMCYYVMAPFFSRNPSALPQSSILQQNKCEFCSAAILPPFHFLHSAFARPPKHTNPPTH